MDISAEKTKLMTNNTSDQSKWTEAWDCHKLQVPGLNYNWWGFQAWDTLKGITDNSSMTRLKPVWIDKRISLSSKIRMMRSPVTAIFLYACESWTLTAELQRRIQAMEMRCYIPQDTTHLIQRPCYQRGSPCQDPAGNWTTWRSDDRKETQTSVVWLCFLFIRSSQNHLARHSERGKKTRQTEEEVGRQH